jgi:hypothetical protein
LIETGCFFYVIPREMAIQLEVAISWENAIPNEINDYGWIFQSKTVMVPGGNKLLKKK